MCITNHKLFSLVLKSVKVNCVNLRELLAQVYDSANNPLNQFWLAEVNNDLVAPVSFS